MKVKTTPEQYAERMRRRKPEPKKGKSRKDSSTVNRESNAALVAKIKTMEAHHVQFVGASNYTRAVLERALEKAASTVRMLPVQEFVDKAEAEIREEMGKNDA
jgi:hypothetical protein